MDKQSNSTTAPEISTLVAGTKKQEVTHHLSAEDLQKLSMADLRSVLHLLVAVSDATNAYLNAPRFDGDGRSYNAAGKLAEKLLDHLDWCVSLAEQVAKDAKPDTREEAEDRAWMLIQRAACYSENLANFVAVAAQLSVEASSVEGA